MVENTQLDDNWPPHPDDPRFVCRFRLPGGEIARVNRRHPPPFLVAALAMMSDEDAAATHDIINFTRHEPWFWDHFGRFVLEWGRKTNNSYHYIPKWPESHPVCEIVEIFHELFAAKFDGQLYELLRASPQDYCLKFINSIDGNNDDLAFEAGYYMLRHTKSQTQGMKLLMMAESGGSLNAQAELGYRLMSTYKDSPAVEKIKYGLDKLTRAANDGNLRAIRILLKESWNMPNIFAEMNANVARWIEVAAHGSYSDLIELCARIYDPDEKSRYGIPKNKQLAQQYDIWAAFAGNGYAQWQLGNTNTAAAKAWRQMLMR